MLIKRALIKSLKNSQILAEGLVSIEMRPSNNPDKPRPSVSLTVKGWRADLDGMICILWINEKVNGQVILAQNHAGSLASSFIDQDKTEFRVELNDKLAYNDEWSKLRSFPL